MDLTLDDSSVAAQQSVRSVIARRPGLAAARAAEPLGFDASLWRELCAAGLPGLAAPEEYGGAGGPFAALVPVALELGKVLAPVPFVEHAVAVRLLAAGAPDHPDLAAVAAGELIATLAPQVRGELAVAVPAGAVAHLVLAMSNDNLIAVRSEPTGRAIPNSGALPLADRDLTSGDVCVLASGAAATAMFDHAYDEWLTLTAALLAGLSGAALDLATTWVQERQQFGVPIGTFQAVQHGLADLPGKVEGATLLAREAAWGLETGTGSETGAGPDALPAMALTFAAATAQQATGRLVQYHGGLGVAIEHDAQLFYRRARAYPLVTGRPLDQQRAIGKALLDRAPESGEPADDTFRHARPLAAFVREVREFLAEHLSEEQRHRMHATGTVHDPEFHRQLAKRGWLTAPAASDTSPADGPAAGPGEQPFEFPGPFELAAFFRELENSDAPFHGTSTTMIVAGVLARLGTPELQRVALPRLLSGETIAVLGYSEPESGSDVFAARTRAVPEGDPPRQWRISGQKMWTTLAQEAGYVLLLTRSDPELPKHRGLTMFLVPLDTPGITIQPIHTIADERTNVVFYDEVLVPDDYRVGEINGGARVMGTALSFERGVMGGTSMNEPLVRAALAWAREAGPDGQRPGDDPAVLEAIGRAATDAEVAWLLTQWTAWIGASGGSPADAGNMARLFASVAYQVAAAEIQQVAGLAGIVHHTAAGSALVPAADGEIERAARHCAVLTIQGGTTEVQRNHVAEHVLGLPKTRSARVGTASTNRS